MSFNEHYSGQYNAQYSTFQYNYNHQFGLHYNPVPVENKIISDEEFVAQWNEKIKHRVVSKSQNKKASIQQAREKLSKLILLIDEIKIHEKTLTDNISTMSNAEWNDKFNDINAKKTEVNAIMSALNDSYLDSLRVSLAKRSAKRLRLKKLKLRRAEARQQALKERDEKIRRIDENLQKMKDELERNKREEEYKRQADIFLRDVFRKKHDAKKCIAKLEALMKLRKARATTALGRGERVSESGGKMFNENMEKLIALWRHKLAGYEKEELELNLKLKAKSQDSSQGETAHNTVNTLSMWREAMFGSTDAMPQRDFNGNLAGFIAVRHKWDEYISEGGTPIPVGWLLPQELSYELP